MGTYESVKTLLNHKDTQYIMIDYDNGIENKLLTCILTSTIDVTPGGILVQYIITCKKILF